MTTVSERFAHTARRLKRLAGIQRGLLALQARRRKQIGLHTPTIMYDTITLDAVPPDAPAVAGYVGGHWPTYSALAHRFPRARRLSIAVTASQDAECLDVEPGDARPDQAAAWYKRQKARGVKRPVIYTSVSQAPALVAELARQGIKRSSFRLWTAHYTGRAHLCGPGCGFGMQTRADATQWTDKALGRNLDESLLAADFWS